MGLPRWVLRLGLVCAASWHWGCGGATPSSQTGPVARRPGPAVSYSFVDMEGKPVSPDSMRGRVTLVALVTTYDWGSHLVLRRVNQALGSHTPRINAFAMVLEASSYAVLLPTFSRSLGLHFPLVMADQASLEGGGPFGPIGYVPALVVLDRRGRVSERLEGLLTPEQVEAALDRADAAPP